MTRRITRVLGRVPAEVAFSLGLHLLLFAALFLLPGVLLPGPEPSQASMVRVEPDVPIPLEAPPEPPPTVPREIPDVLPEPALPEEPPEEPPPFEADPPALPHSPPSPADLPRSAGRKIIGVGGGGGSTARESPPPPPVFKPAPPPPPPPPPTAARPERAPSPEYPPRAVAREMEGHVLLLVEVLPDGSVGEVTVKESSGHAILDRAAIDAVRKWSFRPATVQGQPARSLVEVPFNFRLTD